ncbi:hypothetical protein FisN_18Lh055 [Fistulifera solaris]|uniref:NAD(P)-binding domain-containing protein n=1 Tax=Fistulifera solaris TaxID=1519565 RepID=A0A1Z5KE07_FISSO|nr:hypothetical protein FisN_18Lh055 [Fistulifera solaris]|eukprot:GAX24503.1 hypothetical protein FisN_18Lh055 [Fistulifera solaris]
MEINEANLLKLKQATGALNAPPLRASSRRSSYSSYWMPTFSDDEDDKKSSNKNSWKSQKQKDLTLGEWNTKGSFRSAKDSIRGSERFDGPENIRPQRSFGNEPENDEDQTVLTKSSRPTTIHIPKDALREHMNDTATYHTKKTIASGKSSNSKLSKNSKTSKTSQTSHQMSKASTSYSKSASTQQIALFGANTKTGHCFLRLALDAGYRVRTMDATDISQPSLRKCKTIQHTLRNATFVVCFCPDVLPKLYPLMKKEEGIQVLLYQASSLCTDVSGDIPVLAKVLNAVSQVRRRKDLHNDAVNFIGREHGILATSQEDGDDCEEKPPHFSFIVTRPTVLLRDGPSSRKLAPSKSQPGPLPISYVDLAEFSLNALRNEKLYNTCPYVVADSF